MKTSLRVSAVKGQITKYFHVAKTERSVVSAVKGQITKYFHVAKTERSVVSAVIEQMSNKLDAAKSMFLLLIFVFISGCASFWAGNETKAPKPYHKPMYIDESYSLSGRFSINSNHNHEYGNYTWMKLESHEEMNFNTPLGQTVAKIVIESGVVTLTTKAEVYVGNDVDDMLYDNIGFDLPVDYLHFWVQGLPLPNQPITQYLPDGFEQMGWRVEYLEWSDINHPHIIKCTNQDLVIKLLINWN